jgi:hypothetical protein
MPIANKSWAAPYWAWKVAMMGKLPYTALRDGVFTHPTPAEGLNYLFMTLDS